MDWLSTVCALLFAGVSSFFAWRAADSAQQAKHSHDRLVQSRGRLVANELAIEELQSSFKRLNGRVNAELHRRKGVVIEGEYEHVEQPSQPSFNGLDPELAAELALQRAPAASPGKGA